MKTILVLTDFTEKATDAAKSAVLFAAKLQANLLLFNTYITAALVPQYVGGPWVIDEIIEREEMSKEKLQELAKELEIDIAKLNFGQNKPTVHVRCGDGTLPVNVEEIINEKNIEMVVMGARSENSIKHMLNGSDICSVIDKGKRPVLVIPENIILEKIEKVVFATDFEEADIKALQYLVSLGELFNFQLEIVHITLTGKSDIAKNAFEETFLNQVRKLKYRHIVYKVIKGKDITNRLNDYCNEDGATILALVHYQDSFIVRLLRKSVTKKALSIHQIPLLVLPSKMDGKE